MIGISLVFFPDIDLQSCFEKYGSLPGLDDPQTELSVMLERV